MTGTRRLALICKRMLERNSDERRDAFHIIKRIVERAAPTQPEVGDSVSVVRRAIIQARLVKAIETPFVIIKLGPAIRIGTF
jgi:hypothetical protein